MASYRRYSEQEKAEALAFVDACRGNYQEASKKTGIPWTTLRAWHQGIGVNEVTSENSLHKKRDLATEFRKKAWTLFDAIDSDRINQANITQLTIAIGTLIDKAVLLEDVKIERAIIAAEQKKENARTQENGTGDSGKQEETAEQLRGKVIVQYYDDDTSTAFAQSAEADTEGSQAV